MYIGQGLTALNTSSVAYTAIGSKRTESSQGYFAYIYEDFVVFRGRDFIKNKWIPEAQFVVYRKSK